RLCPDGGDRFRGLLHFRPARRDELVHPPHSGIDHLDAGLDKTKPLQRDVGRLAINEPRAEDADEAEADEQDGNGDSAKANYFLENRHARFRCSFQTTALLSPNERRAGLPAWPLRRNKPCGMASSL